MSQVTVTIRPGKVMWTIAFIASPAVAIFAFLPGHLVDEWWRVVFLVSLASMVIGAAVGCFLHSRLGSPTWSSAYLVATWTGLHSLLLLAGLAAAFHLDLQLLGLATAVMSFAGAAWCLTIFARCRGGEEVEDDPGAGVWGRLALLVGMTGSVAVTARFVGVVRTGDRWTYLALIQNHLHADHLASVNAVRPGLPVDWRQAYDGWGVLLAFISKLSSVDPVDLYSIILPPLVVILIVWTHFEFASELLGSRRFGGCAALLQSVFLATAAPNTDGLGFVVLGRSVEDKVVAAFVMFPAVTTLMSKYTRTGNWCWLGALGVVTVGGSFIHPLAGPFAAIGILSVFASDLGGREHPRRSSWRCRSLVPLGLVAVSLVVPMAQRVEYGAPVARVEHTSKRAPAGLLAELDSKRNTLVAWDEDGDKIPDTYMMSPRVLDHPMIISVLVLLPWLCWNGIKGKFHQGQRTALVLAVVPLTVLFIPPLATLLSRLVSPWLLWRFSWLVPFPILLTLGVQTATDPRIHSPTSTARAARIAAACVAFAGVALSIPAARRSYDFMAFWFGRTVEPAEREFIEKMGDRLESGAIVMAPRELADLIPGLAPGLYPASFRNVVSHVKVQRWYQKSHLDLDSIRLLEVSHCRYVVLRRWIDWKPAVVDLHQIFRPVLETPTFEVFEFTAPMQPDPVLVGNTLLAAGAQADASASFAMVRRRQPALASLGLARVRLAEGRREEAVGLLEEVVRLRPQWLPARILLAGSRARLGRQTKDPDQIAEATESFIGLLQIEPWTDHAHGLIIQGSRALTSRQRRRFLQEDAERLVRTSQLQDDPREVLYALAEVYSALESPSRSLAVYDRIVDAWPRESKAHQRRARILARLGRSPAAIDAYQRAIRADPRWRTPYLALYELLRADGQMAQAERWRRRAERMVPHLDWPAVPFPDDQPDG
jgi:tetratricopeptide (TPR) repeat protein